MSRHFRMQELSAHHSLNEPVESEEKPKRSLGVRYVYCLNSFRFLVIAFWIAALGVGAFFAPQYFSHTKDVFSAPKGTPAAAADDQWHKYYDSRAHVHTMLAVVHSVAGTSLVADPAALAFCQSVDAALQTQLNRSSPALENAEYYRSLSGYFEAEAVAGPLAGQAFLGKADATMFWTIQYEPVDDEMSRDITRHIRDVIDSLNTLPDVYSVGATGNELLGDAIGEGTESDSFNNDSIVLPIAMFVLCLYLKSLRLMILPLVCVGLSLVSAFCIMLPIAMYAANVTSFAPSFQISLTIAMSVDYSLFLLTRYREEILGGLHQKEIDAIASTVTHSGEVILASGITLAVTFASLIAFPMDFLSSIGMGSCISIICCLVVNLTFTPAMLLTFPRFFSDFRIFPRFLLRILPRSYTEDVPMHRFGDQGLNDAFDVDPRVSRLGGLEEELLYAPDAEMSFGNGVPHPVTSSASKGRSKRPTSSHEDELSVSTSVRPDVGIVNEDGVAPEVRQRRSNNPRLVSLRQRQKESFWYKSAVFSTTSWVSVLLVLIVLGGSIPFLIACTHLTHTIDQGQLLPRGAPAVTVFNQLKEELPPGLLDQYQILVVLDQTKLPAVELGPVPILSPTYFSFTRTLVDRLMNQGLVQNTSVASVVYADGMGVSSQEATAYLAPKACPQSPLACLYQQTFKRSANNGLDSNVTLITIITPFPPLGDEAEPWLRQVRDVMGDMEDLSNSRLNGAIQLYITGGATSAIDAVNKIYQLFPYVVLATVAIVLLIASLVFKSVFLPLRLVLTLSLPLVFTYGLAIYIFQENKMDWLGSVVANTHAIHWLDPVMAFSILIGLGLDYDIFLYSRVQEFRALGYSNTAAVRKGIYKTGAIITGAGVIMAIAFAGLIFAHELVLNIVGFMICFAVLVDTFVIRTLLVPAILHLAGEWNYFPTKMPMAVKGDMEQEAEDEIEAATLAAESYTFR